MTQGDPPAGADPVVRIASRGDGVTQGGRYVAFGVPGDHLDASGTLIEGPHHAVPPCRHFPECGGCQLQHVADSALHDFVRDRVVGALTAQGLSADAVSPAWVAAPKTRRRAALRALKVGKRVVIGFAQAGSHSIVDMRECWLLEPALFACVQALRPVLADLIPDRRPVEVSMTLLDQGVDLMLSGVRVDGLPAIDAVTDFARSHGLARLTVDQGYGAETMWEPEPASITLSGVAVRPAPFPFLQATAEAERVLIDAVLTAVAGAPMVADLFAGIGTFALALRAAGHRVYAAEAARDAIAALAGAVSGSATGAPVVTEHRDLYRRPLTPAELNRFGAVVLDPPRAGAADQMAQLAAATVPVIAYVSCNPATFARDAAVLTAGGYALDAVKPVGQFRWSTHVELVGVFRRAA